MDKNIVELFKAFSDPNRLEIIRLLIKGQNCSCNLVEQLPISQPTLSYHLKQISKSKLAVNKRDGNWIKYYVDKDKIDEMIQFLQELKEIEELSCKS